MNYVLELVKTGIGWQVTIRDHEGRVISVEEGKTLFDVFDDVAAVLSR